VFERGSEEMNHKGKRQRIGRPSPATTVAITGFAYPDGVGPPQEYSANGESAYYCVYPLVR
jgi:hypothetical protein